jgi:HTH-type transcriptional regulator, competence development regulator
MSMLGKRLKFLREKHNFSQKRVADSIGISNTQLSRYESGDRNPDPELISKFADYYEVTTDYLHGRSDDPKGYSGADIYFEDKKGNTIGIIEVKNNKNTYDPLAEINKLIKEFGIEDVGFFDIEKWKNLTPEDVEEIRKHFEWVAHKAKERNEEK